jgi:hypothetical protein
MKALILALIGLLSVAAMEKTKVDPWSRMPESAYVDDRREDVRDGFKTIAVRISNEPLKVNKLPPSPGFAGTGGPPW